MVISIPEIPGVEIPEPNNRIIKTLMSPELNNCDHTVLISLIKPGNSTGIHTHKSDEYMYVATGRGEAISIKDGKEVLEKVTPDSLIFAPEGEKHSIRNTGDETLKLVCVYYPAIEPTGKFKESIDIQL
jgi:mannose-6-phosphate isomerase-like protein (cupin superfamily)